ncbi:MAG: DUF3455 domain-containing protein [Steroidobacteraceae bacterium]
MFCGSTVSHESEIYSALTAVLRRLRMRSRLSPSTIYTYLAFVAGCATSPHVAPPEVPTVLQPPAGQILYLEALATGVQIYECAQKTDLTYEWAFKAPEASLVSRSGHPLGKHYAGPTWESIDGSTVVGVIKARDPGPKNSAIPWLLLAVKATTGAGTFGTTKSIQRVATVGGIAPAEPCASSNLKQVAKVPYKATYYFYR